MIAYLKLWLTRRRVRRMMRQTEDRIVAGSVVERARQWEGAGDE